MLCYSVGWSIRAFRRDENLVNSLHSGLEVLSLYLRTYNDDCGSLASFCSKSLLFLLMG